MSTEATTVPVLDEQGREIWTVNQGLGGVVLPVTVDQILDSQRDGDGLVLTLSDGRLILVRDFYTVDVVGEVLLLVADDFGGIVALRVTDDGQIVYLETITSDFVRAPQGEAAASEASANLEAISQERLDELLADADLLNEISRSELDQILAQQGPSVEEIEAVAAAERAAREARTKGADGGLFDGISLEMAGGGLGLLGGAAAFAGGDDEGGGGGGGRESAEQALNAIIRDANALTVGRAQTAGLQGITAGNRDNMVKVLAAEFGPAEEPNEAARDVLESVDLAERLRRVQALVGSVNEQVGEGETIVSAESGSLELEVDSPDGYGGDGDRMVFIVQDKDYLPAEVRISLTPVGGTVGSTQYDRIEVYEFDDQGHVVSKSTDGTEGVVADGSVDVIQRYRAPQDGGGTATGEDEEQLARITDESLLYEMEWRTYQDVDGDGTGDRLVRVDIDNLATGARVDRRETYLYSDSADRTPDRVLIDIDGDGSADGSAQYQYDGGGRLTRIDEDADDDGTVNERREYTYATAAARQAESEKVSTDSDDDGTLDDVAIRYYDSGTGDRHSYEVRDGDGTTGPDGTGDLLAYRAGVDYEHMLDGAQTGLAGVETVRLAGRGGATTLEISDADLTELAGGRSGYALAIDGQSDDTVRFAGDVIYRTGLEDQSGRQEYQGTSGKVYVQADVEVSGVVAPLPALLRYLSAATVEMFGLAGVDGVDAGNVASVKATIGAYGASTTPALLSLTTAQVGALVDTVNDHVPPGGTVDAARVPAAGTLVLEINEDADAAHERKVEIVQDSATLRPASVTTSHDSDGDGVYERVEDDTNADGTVDSRRWPVLLQDGTQVAEVYDDGLDSIPDRLVFIDGVASSLTLTDAQAEEYRGIGMIDLADDEGTADGATTFAMSDAQLTVLADRDRDGTSDSGYQLVIGGESDDTVQFTGDVIYQTGNVIDGRNEYRGSSGTVLVDSAVTVSGAVDPLVAVLRHLSIAGVEMFGLAGVTGVDAGNIANVKATLGAYSAATSPARESLSLGQVQALADIAGNADYVPAGARVINSRWQGGALLLDVSTDRDAGIEVRIEAALDAASFAVQSLTRKYDENDNFYFERVVADSDGDGTVNIISYDVGDDGTAADGTGDVSIYDDGTGAAGATADDGTADRLVYAAGADVTVEIPASGPYAGIRVIQLAEADGTDQGESAVILGNAAIEHMFSAGDGTTLTIDGGSDDTVRLGDSDFVEATASDTATHKAYLASNGARLVLIDMDIRVVSDFALGQIRDDVDGATVDDFAEAGITGVDDGNLGHIKTALNAFDGYAQTPLAEMSRENMQHLVDIVGTLVADPATATIASATAAYNMAGDRHVLTLSIDTDTSDTLDSDNTYVIRFASGDDLRPVSWSGSHDTDKDGTVDSESHDYDADGTDELTIAYTRDAAGTITGADYDYGDDTTVNRSETYVPEAGALAFAGNEATRGYAEDIHGGLPGEDLAIGELAAAVRHGYPAPSRASQVSYDDNDDTTVDRIGHLRHDSQGHLVEIGMDLDADGTADRVETYDYNGLHQVSGAQFRLGTDATADVYLEQYYDYDDFGRLERISSDTNGDGTMEEIRVFEYDDLGRVQYSRRIGGLEIRQTPVGGGFEDVAEYHEDHTQEYQYNDLGQIVRSQEVANSMDRDGDTSVYKEYEWDDQGRLSIERVDLGDFSFPPLNPGNPPVQSAFELEYRYSYDDEGRVTGREDFAANPITGMLGQITAVSFEYDDLGRLVKRVEVDQVAAGSPTRTYLFSDELGFVFSESNSDVRAVAYVEDSGTADGTADRLVFEHAGSKTVESSAIDAEDIAGIQSVMLARGHAAQGGAATTFRVDDDFLGDLVDAESSTGVRTVSVEGSADSEGTADDTLNFTGTGFRLQRYAHGGFDLYLDGDGNRLLVEQATVNVSTPLTRLIAELIEMDTVGALTAQQLADAGIAGATATMVSNVARVIEAFGESGANLSDPRLLKILDYSIQHALPQYVGDTWAVTAAYFAVATEVGEIAENVLVLDINEAGDSAGRATRSVRITFGELDGNPLPEKADFDLDFIGTHYDLLSLADLRDPPDGFSNSLTTPYDLTEVYTYGSDQTVSIELQAFDGTTVGTLADDLDAGGGTGSDGEPEELAIADNLVIDSSLAWKLAGIASIDMDRTITARPALTELVPDVTTTEEVAGIDTDGDGTVQDDELIDEVGGEVLFTDSNNDGIPDITTEHGDGTPDYLNVHGSWELMGALEARTVDGTVQSVATLVWKGPHLPAVPARDETPGNSRNLTLDDRALSVLADGDGDGVADADFKLYVRGDVQDEVELRDIVRASDLDENEPSEDDRGPDRTYHAYQGTDGVVLVDSEIVVSIPVDPEPTPGAVRLEEIDTDANGTPDQIVRRTYSWTGRVILEEFDDDYNGTYEEDTFDADRIVRHRYVAEPIDRPGASDLLVRSVLYSQVDSDGDGTWDRIEFSDDVYTSRDRTDSQIGAYRRIVMVGGGSSDFHGISVIDLNEGGDNQIRMILDGATSQAIAPSGHTTYILGDRSDHVQLRYLAFNGFTSSTTAVVAPDDSDFAGTEFYQLTGRWGGEIWIEAQIGRPDNLSPAGTNRQPGPYRPLSAMEFLSGNVIDLNEGKGNEVELNLSTEEIRALTTDGGAGRDVYVLGDWRDHIRFDFDAFGFTSDTTAEAAPVGSAYEGRQFFVLRGDWGGALWVEAGADGIGRPDDAGPASPVAYWTDTNRDGTDDRFIEYTDENGDSMFDRIREDTNGDGTFDVVREDKNLDALNQDLYRDYFQYFIGTAINSVSRMVNTEALIIATPDEFGIEHMFLTVNFEHVEKDTDFDGTFDTIEVDRDGDGTHERVEKSTDDDGTFNRVEVDRNDNGSIDRVEMDGNKDGTTDRIERYLNDSSSVYLVEEDTDNDGTFDRVTTDGSFDGSYSVNEVDQDGDGDIDVIHLRKDTNSDGTYDHIEIDANGDGTFERLRQLRDTNSNSAYDRIEVDYDDDGTFEYVEIDTDHSGVFDRVERDPDDDGTVSHAEVDTDGDGTVNRIENDDNDDGSVNSIVIDTDDDGTANRYEIDTVGNGTLDRFEIDSDDDGRIDRVEFDTDGDGAANRAENNVYDAAGRLIYQEHDAEADGTLDSVVFENLNTLSYSPSAAKAAEWQGIEGITLAEDGKTNLILTLEAFVALNAGTMGFYIDGDIDMNTVNYPNPHYPQHSEEQYTTITHDGSDTVRISLGEGGFEKQDTQEGGRDVYHYTVGGQEWKLFIDPDITVVDMSV